MAEGEGDGRQRRLTEERCQLGQVGQAGENGKGATEERLDELTGIEPFLGT